jgi:membrane protein YqaA with SNARE-associated domain
VNNALELWGLLGASFLSSTVLPGGSEIAFIALATTQRHELVTLVAVATVGNSLGGMTSWGIGRLLPVAPDKRSGADSSAIQTESSQVPQVPQVPQVLTRAEKARETIRRFGAVALLVSWVPIVGDPLCVAAGWARIGWLRALAFITLGKCARYAALAWFI